MAGKKTGRKWGELRPENVEARQLALFLRARVDESGKTLRMLAPEVGNAESVISTYLGGKIPTRRFVTALIAATVPAQLREKRQAEAADLLAAALHPPRRPERLGGRGEAVGNLVDVATAQAQHLETYAHLTRALEQQNELRQAAANSEKLVLVLHGMIGSLQERVTRLTDQRDRLDKGTEAVERKLARALGQQHRAESELGRAREKQRQAEELAARLQEKIDRLAGELDRLRAGKGPAGRISDSAVLAAGGLAGSEDSDGDDIDAALARAEAVNDSGGLTLERISDELADEDDVAVASSRPAIVSHDTDVPGSLTARHHRANQIGEAGEAGTARDLLVDVVADCTRVLGPDDLTTLTARHHHAYWTGEAGEAGTARDLLADVVADCTRVLGPDNPGTLSARDHHAVRTGEAGETGTAWDLLADVVADCTRVLGPDDPTTLTARQHHANQTGETGNAGAARDLLADLIADRSRVLGSEHSDTLAARHHHADWVGEVGDAAVARDLLVDIVADRSRILGPNDSATLTSRHHHAYWTGEAGDASDARDLLVDVIACRSRVLGPDDPATLIARQDHANRTGEAGDAGTARSLLGDVVADYTRVLGPEHPSTLTARHGQACWTGEAGDAGIARDLLLAVVVDRSRILGQDHPDTVSARRHHAYWIAIAGTTATTGGLEPNGLTRRRWIWSPITSWQARRLARLTGVDRNAAWVKLRVTTHPEEAVLAQWVEEHRR
ncbi:tetratricopeptide repeat protein [Streptomyces sp. NPDC096339]|uniref:tetratricopeptide repeat protein n=1 Tax=Streptomyces sp. NPDC096339 TaxID=3366086 RepID=UPI003815C7F9